MRSFLFLGFVLVVVSPACDKKDDATANPAPAPTGAPAPGATPAPVVDACTVVVKADVEAAVGRAALDALKDTTANLSSCMYGDPKQPLAAGRPTEFLVNASLLSADSAADAKKVVEMARSNAGDVEPMAGLGDVAFWDKSTRGLNVAKGRFQLLLLMGMEAGGRDAAKAIAEKALARLP